MKGMTEDTIKNAWKTTGNWPISRRKALIHPEIQVDKEKRRAPESDSEVPGDCSDDDALKTGRDIMNLAGPNATAGDRRKFRKIGLAFDAKEAQLTIANQRIQELEAQVARLTTKKRKAVPNPNQKFMSIEDILGKDEQAEDAQNEEIEAEEEVEAEEEAEDEDDEVDDDEEVELPAEVRTRSGRQTKVPARYTN